MAYQRRSVWEDEDKWDIHKTDSGYSKGGGYKATDKEGEQVYKNKEQYGANKEDEDIKGDYVRKGEKEEKKDEKKDELSETVEQEEKYKDNKETDDEQVKIMAAEEISGEIKNQPKKAEKKKNAKTIEDAINKAVEEEKKVRILDN